MGKNFMPEIARLLGLKLRERFQVHDTENDVVQDWCEYIITDKGVELCWVDHSNEPKEGWRIVHLDSILCGEFAIIKLPEFPKWRDVYYYPNVDTVKVEYCEWGGTTLDLALRQIGMVYKHRGEADAHFPYDYEKLTGKKLEVDNG